MSILVRDSIEDRGFNDRMANQNGSFQARAQMRVPDHLVQFLHQFHVIGAITRHPEIDNEDLYGQALAGLKHGDNAKAFSDFGEFVRRVTSGTPPDDKSDAPVRTSLRMDVHDVDEHTCSRIRDFNRRYLNDKGGYALLRLLTFHAGDLDPAAIDVWRGGEALRATYGPRRTRRDKKLGKEMQSWLKGLKSADEPAMMEAADHYVEYRYLDNGSLPDYMRRKELDGNARGAHYYRDWFRKFDEAFEFPSPRPGRPSNTPDHH